MESPLDILSRAAGMVSRSNSKNKDFDSSTDCRILKFCLVNESTAEGNRFNCGTWMDKMPRNGLPTPPSGTDDALVRNLEPTPHQGSRNKDNQLPDDDVDDKPIDMSINKLNSQMHGTLKRKLDPSNDGRSVIVHKRPSVITYADVHEDISSVQCDIVDEHFKRALGIQSYNEVFKGEKKTKAELCDSTKQKEEPSEEVNVKAIKTVDKPCKEDKSHNNSNTHSSNYELSVDDHFAKCLGKSTWMRLQKKNLDE